MFGIGGTELAIILLFAFLIVGPEKLPDIGRTVGRAIRQFRNAQDEMNRVIRTEVYDPIMDNKPLKDPTEILTGKKQGEKRQVKTVDEAGTETFAERRARLARERAAAQEAKEQAAAAETVAVTAATTASVAATAPKEPAEQNSVETFAQRRARLEAERAARAAAKAKAAEEPAAEAVEKPEQTLADALYGVPAAPVANGEEEDAKGVE